MEKNKKREIAKHKTLSSRFKMYITGEKAYKKDKASLRKVYRMLYLDNRLCGCLKNSGDQEIVDQIISKIQEKRELSNLEELAIHICKYVDDPYAINYATFNTDLQEIITQVTKNLRMMNCAQNEKAKKKIKEIEENLKESSNNMDKSLGKVDAIKKTVMGIKKDDLETITNLEIWKNKIDSLMFLQEISSNEGVNKEKLLKELNRRNGTEKVAHHSKKNNGNRINSSNVCNRIRNWNECCCSRKQKK